MITKTKLALVAAIALAGIASPALAEGIPQHSPSSDAWGQGAAPAQHSRQTAVRGRTFYDSTATPNDNWANDAAGSAAARGMSR